MIAKVSGTYLWPCNSVQSPLGFDGYGCTWVTDQLSVIRLVYISVLLQSTPGTRVWINSDRPLSQAGPSLWGRSGANTTRHEALVSINLRPYSFIIFYSKKKFFEILRLRSNSLSLETSIDNGNQEPITWWVPAETQGMYIYTHFLGNWNRL